MIILQINSNLAFKKIKLINFLKKKLNIQLKKHLKFYNKQFKLLFKPKTLKLSNYLYKKYLKDKKIFKLRDFGYKYTLFKKKKFIPFRFDERPKKRKNKKTQTFKKELYFMRNRIRFLYGDLRPKKHWIISYNLKKKLKELTFERSVSSFENRIDVLLVRTNLATSLLEARKLLKKKYITLNNKILTAIHYIIKPYDLISIRSNFKPLFRKHLLYQLKQSFTENNGLQLIPEYLEFNYKLMSFTYIPKLLRRNMLVFNFRLKKNLIFGLGKRNII